MPSGHAHGAFSLFDFDCPGFLEDKRGWRRGATLTLPIAACIAMNRHARYGMTGT
jgi:hypothetical protein